jgi:hypothetical protein
MVPFLGVLLMHMFRLDERISAPKAPSRNRRFFCGLDPKGRPYVSDPDRQPWRRQGICEIEARLQLVDHSKGRDSIGQVGSPDLGLTRKRGSIVHI